MDTRKLSPYEHITVPRETRTTIGMNKQATLIYFIQGIKTLKIQLQSLFNLI